LEQARPLGIADGIAGGAMLPHINMPAEHLSHSPDVHFNAEWAAFLTALLGFAFATALYGLRRLDPEDVRRQFAEVYQFLVHKWWIDELYARVFVRPTLRISGWVAGLDKRGIDGVVDRLAMAVAGIARFDNWIDRMFVDRLVNSIARWTYSIGIRLRRLQTGNIRQYVMWLAFGTVMLFILISAYWNFSMGIQM
jgi:NADH-quinone oxidoreductase subunit L